MKRFASYSREEIAEKKKLLTPKTTAKNEKSAANTFREYLKEKGHETRFEMFSKDELNARLSTFYVEARTRSGELYKLTSLMTFRYGLSRYLKKTEKHASTDIIEDSEFVESNESFKVASQMIKKAGKAEIKRFPAITEEDRQKLYTSLFFNTKTPVGLYNKVQFDVRFYFSRRGVENMDTMTKDSFIVGVNAKTGRVCVTKRDELTKNHREDDTEAHGGVMVATPTDDCPVKSFLKYRSKLHPDQERFWCYPKDTFREDDECWYTKKPVGANTLANFLQNLSEKVGLSRRYTNHSCRVSAATLLHQEGDFSQVAIQSITGHKSLSSLAIYQKTSEEQKIEMADSLHSKLRATPTATVTSRSGQAHSAARGGSSATEAATMEDLEVVFDESNEPLDPTVPGPSFAPIFNNCTVTNLTIVYNTKN